MSDGVRKDRKRKRTTDEDATETFEAKAFHSSEPQSTITLALIRRVDRLKFPLYWLRTNHDRNFIAPNGLLIVDCLPEPRAKEVLIVRHSPNGGLCAVEHVRDNVHIAIPLQSWITQERVLLPTGDSCTDDDLCQLQQRTQWDQGLPQISSILIQKDIASTKKPKNRRGILARKAILPAKEPARGSEAQSVLSETLPAQQIGMEGPSIRALEVGDTSLQPPAAQLPVVNPLDNSNEDTNGEAKADHGFLKPLAAALQTPEGISPVDSLRTQYLEMLYMSKTSLAYFAKGALTRARLWSQTHGSLEQQLALTGLYRQSLLTPMKFDLKYKESLPDVIRAAAMMELSAGSGDLIALPLVAKKRKATTKVGNNALYVDEGKYVLTWWQNRNVRSSNGPSAQSTNSELKNLLNELRQRETGMQIMLMLETMALESSSDIQTALTNETQMRSAAAIDPAGDRGTAASKKSRKRRDLTGDLEGLLDRLCIWQTVGIDELLASPHRVASDSTDSSRARDKLREFCADVIIPFYAHRLGEVSKLVCKRLGGPEISPKRPKPPLTKSSSTSRISSVPASKKTQQKAVFKRTLERVLSEDHSSRHASPPVLSRSSTMSLVPNLKREPSESFHRPASRGNIQRSVSFSNREVDLIGDAKIHDAKRKKLARLAVQKRELDAAIDALKKPNRTKTGQTIMDEFERRTTENQAYKPTHQTVQIIATPKGRSRIRPSAGAGLAAIEAPAEEPMVPASTVRPQAPEPGSLASSSKPSTKRPILATIQNTPSRANPAMHKTIPLALHRPQTVPSQNPDSAYDINTTPVAARRSQFVPPPVAQVEATPLRRGMMTKSQRPVLFTPLRKTDVSIEDAFRDAPVITTQAGQAMDRVMRPPDGVQASIYDSLGWNDDFD